MIDHEFIGQFHYGLMWMSLSTSSEQSGIRWTDESKFWCLLSSRDLII